MIAAEEDSNIRRVSNLPVTGDIAIVGPNVLYLERSKSIRDVSVMSC